MRKIDKKAKILKNLLSLYKDKGKRTSEFKRI